MAPPGPDCPRLGLLLVFIALSSCAVGRTRAFLGPAAVVSRPRSARRPPTLLPAARKGGKRSRPRSPRKRPPSPPGGAPLGFGPSSRPGPPGGGGGEPGAASASAPTGPPPPPSQSDSPVHSDLIRWIKSSDDAHVSPKFAVRPSDLGGYGGFAAEPIGRDEVLFRIPRSMCVTHDDALSDMYSGEYYGVIKDRGVKDWGLILLAGWLAEERMLSEDSRKAGSEIYTKHKAYTDSVPWGPGEFGQDHVLYWTDEEVDRRLGGSRAHDDAVLIRRTADGAARMVGEFALPVLMGNRVDLELEDTSLDTLQRDWADTVRAAMAICLSRSFGEEVEADGGRVVSEVCLLPLIDVLQHSDEPNTRLESYDDSILVLAARDVDRNEELFHRYREEDGRAMPGHRWFTRYGFVPGNDVPVEELLRDRSGVFFDS